MTPRLVPVFDLDGTLLDSDEALVQAFVVLGVPRDRIGFGEPVAEACERFGVPLETYVAAYDPALVQPYPGVADLLAGLGRWAVCSNKHPSAGALDLARWGWHPDVALFSDAFGWAPKRLDLVLEALGLGADDVLFVGDSEHDVAAARTAGVRFAPARWNPRAARLEGDVLVSRPQDLLAWC